MRKFILAVLIVLSMTMGFDALALAPVTASPWTTTTNPATARTGLVVYSTGEVAALITAATNGLVTSAITNGLATTNYVNSITNGLATTNYVNSITNGLATTNYANSVTNNFTTLVYTNPSSILYTSSLPALTNGFVTSSVTNGLATTNYVNAATNGLVTSSITNGLATTNYVNAATNGLVTSSVTNGLATTNFVLTQISATNTANLTITTNLVVAATNNFTTLVYSNPAVFLYTNALPGLTNGFVTSSITNGLATTNYVNSAITNVQATNVAGLGTAAYSNAAAFQSPLTYQPATNGAAIANSQLPATLTNNTTGSSANTTNLVGASVTLTGTNGASTASFTTAGVLKLNLQTNFTSSGGVTTGFNDSYTSAFAASNNIVGGTFAGNALNSLVTSLNAAGYYGCVTNGGDIVLYGAQFNPTNNLTFMGRTRSVTQGLNRPAFGDANWAGFLGTNSEQIDGLNLTNWMVVTVCKVNPQYYTLGDAIQAPTYSFNTFVRFQWSFLNTNDGSGSFLCEGANTPFETDMQLFDHTGLNTNLWYGKGSLANNGSGIATNKFSPIGLNGASDNMRNFILPATVAVSGNTTGYHMAWVDTVPTYWGFSGYSTKTNYFQSPVFGTTALTTMRIGGDTNIQPGNYVGFAPFTNSFMQIQSVFILNTAGITNLQAVVNAVYSASFYGDTRRKVVCIYGTSVLCDFQSEGGAFWYSTNSYSALMQTKYPDTIFKNFAMGGASMATMITNPTTKLQYPSTTATAIPKDFSTTVSSDLHRNDIIGGNTVSNTWGLIPVAYAPFLSNNIPVALWQTTTCTTGYQSYVPILMQFNNMLKTNRFAAKLVNASRRTTYGLFSAASPDGVHFTKSEAAMSEFADEWANTGTITPDFPDNITAVTVYTNYMGSVQDLNISAATVFQVWDSSGNTLYSSPVTVSSPLQIQLEPLARYSATTLTGQVKTHMQQ